MAYITLVGAGADRTVIEWDDTADRVGQTGHPLGTYASATFAIDAPYFIAKNITFKVNIVPRLGYISVFVNSDNDIILISHCLWTNH